MNPKPRVALTLGDPGGVGPEVVVRALASAVVQAECDCVVVGDRPVLDAAADALGVRHEEVEMIEMGLAGASDFGAGQVNGRLGDASFRYLEAAIELARSGAVDAIVTGPIHKTAWHRAGHDFPGQTEVLARLTATSDYAMMLAAGAVRSVMVTTHIALADVPGRITAEGVAQKIRLAHRYLPAFVGRAPRIAVAGLNPHAGEEEIFGDEDRRLIAPAVADCRAEGIDVDGPLPADSAYPLVLRGRYDVVVAMYHDQGLIPVKLHDFERGINVTLGLPIVRTSPDHGTAFDIAGRGVASPHSMIEAILASIALARFARSSESGHVAT
jgi:4-phospho-D-threonate 3-dehydrogenase / 4-phospho-D-erythronate 3-dehydrogenase